MGYNDAVPFVVQKWILTMTALHQTTRGHSGFPTHLRPFRVSTDLKAVADLVEFCFADTLDESGRDYLRRMRSAARYGIFLRWTSNAVDWASLPFTGYVWQEGDQLVGNVSLIPYSVRGERRYLIANVAVHPRFRRQGIARQLTLAALRLARQRRARSVWLQVREGNEAALTLYQSLGFVERTRRTTWQSEGMLPDIHLPADARFASLDGRHWPLYVRWFSRDYPPDYSWHLHFELDEMRPDLWGAIYRFIKGTQVKHFAACMGERLLAVVSWRRSASRTHLLWLTVPSHPAEDVVAALLSQARHQLHPRVLSLEYPACSLDQALIRAGFRARQTLIWMESIL